MEMENTQQRPRIALLKRILEVQTVSGHEQDMVQFLVEHCQAEGHSVYSDTYNNVYVTKGETKDYPTVAAHIDTVHQPADVEIRQDGDRLRGFIRGTDVQTGIGADCKTGVFVCLELLRILPTVKVVFFASEEVGCIGARHADRDFFEDIGYVMEFDCPGRNIMSYTSSGVHLFDNSGPFLAAALPVLQEYGVSWQRHPFTDVSVIQPRFKLSCLNLASGYYRWHQSKEYALISDIRNAIEMGAKLIGALGCTYYPHGRSTGAPPAQVDCLNVPERAKYAEPVIPWTPVPWIRQLDEGGDFSRLESHLLADLQSLLAEFSEADHVDSDLDAAGQPERIN